MDTKIINNFENYNEKFVLKYDISDYYQKSNFLVRFIENKRLKWVVRFVDARVGEKIIELGCGAGHILERIKQGQITGVDLSATMLANARKRLELAELSPSVQLIKANVEDLPEELKKKQFDKIILSEVIEHVENPSKVIDQICQISHPQTIIVISIPNEKFINRIKQFFIKIKIFNWLFGNLSRKMDDEWHLHSFDLDLLNQVAGGRLELIKKKAIPFKFLPIRYVVQFSKKT